MMATRVSDSELAARIRQQNRTNSQRRRVKLAATGKVQLLAWIPATLRDELNRLAAARGESLSDTTAVVLVDGLNATTMPAGTVETPPVYTAAVDDKAALMNEVAALLADGLTGADIARRLNSSGKRTATGSEFTSGNLLRDYRAWCKKTGAAE